MLYLFAHFQLDPGRWQHFWFSQCFPRGLRDFWSIFSRDGDEVRSSEAAMGGGARSDLFFVLMGPKRRVRAAHGRVARRFGTRQISL
jgi:hypothetical protein